MIPVSDLKKIVFSLLVITVMFTLYGNFFDNYSRKQYNDDYNLFDSSKINGRVTWIGPYHHGHGIVVNDNDVTYYLFDSLDKIMVRDVTKIGDTFIKAAHSDSMITIKKDGERYIFYLRKKENG